MKLDEKKYSDKEIKFILSKVKDIIFRNIPEGIKEFWIEEMKKTDLNEKKNGQRT